MWCPGCNTDSPMVAVSFSEITCARCGTEVLAARPKTASASNRKKPASRRDSGTPVFRFDSAHPVTGQASQENAVPVSKPAAVRTVEAPATGRPKRARTRIEKPHGTGNRTIVVSASAGEPRATGSTLVFFAGQFLIAWAWYWSSFPAFAAGIVISLSGTFGILRAFQVATSLHRSSQQVPRQSHGGPKSAVGKQRTISRSRPAN